MVLPQNVGQTTLDLNKILSYEYEFIYMRMKSGKNNAKLYYLDTKGVISLLKTDDDVYAYISGETEIYFDRSVYDKRIKRKPLPVRKY